MVRPTAMPSGVRRDGVKLPRFGGWIVRSKARVFATRAQGIQAAHARVRAVAELMEPRTLSTTEGRLLLAPLEWARASESSIAANSAVTGSRA